MALTNQIYIFAATCDNHMTCPTHLTAELENDLPVLVPAHMSHCHGVLRNSINVLVKILAYGVSGGRCKLSVCLETWRGGAIVTE